VILMSKNARFGSIGARLVKLTQVSQVGQQESLNNV